MTNDIAIIARLIDARVQMQSCYNVAKSAMQAASGAKILQAVAEVNAYKDGLDIIDSLITDVVCGEDNDG